MTSKPQPRKPTHNAMIAREYADGKTEWLKCGVAWAGNNGGFVAQLYATPVDGKIIFTPAEK